MDLTGKEINTCYIIRRLIEENSFSSLWNARALFSAKELIIRFLLKKDSEYNEGELTNFKQDIMSFYKIRHPNIIGMIEMDAYNGHSFIVTEFVHGKNLFQYMNSTKSTRFEYILDIIVQITKGLDVIHTNNLVHKNINPESIWLSIDNDGLINAVKITNFVFIDLKNYFDSVSNKGHIKNYEYMAPEVRKNVKNKIDKRCDQYSLGLVFFTLIVGELPFKKDADGSYTILEINEDFVIHSLREKKISETCIMLIVRLLKDNPDDRYVSDYEILYELKKIIFENKFYIKAISEQKEYFGRGIDNLEFDYEIHSYKYTGFETVNTLENVKDWSRSESDYIKELEINKSGDKYLKPDENKLTIDIEDKNNIEKKKFDKNSKGIDNLSITDSSKQKTSVTTDYFSNYSKVTEQKVTPGKVEIQKESEKSDTIIDDPKIITQTKSFELITPVDIKKITTVVNSIANKIESIPDTMQNEKIQSSNVEKKFTSDYCKQDGKEKPEVLEKQDYFSNRNVNSLENNETIDYFIRYNSQQINTKQQSNEISVTNLNSKDTVKENTIEVSKSNNYFNQLYKEKKETVTTKNYFSNHIEAPVQNKETKKYFEDLKPVIIVKEETIPQLIPEPALTDDVENIEEKVNIGFYMNKYFKNMFEKDNKDLVIPNDELEELKVVQKKEPKNTRSKSRSIKKNRMMNFIKKEASGLHDSKGDSFIIGESEEKDKYEMINGLKGFFKENNLKAIQYKCSIKNENQEFSIFFEIIKNISYKEIIKHTIVENKNIQKENIDLLLHAFEDFDSFKNKVLLMNKVDALSIMSELFLNFGNKENPLILVLFNLQNADKSSLELLLALAKKIKQCPLLVIGFYDMFSATNNSNISKILKISVKNT